jgi:hypothetical protein
MPVRSTMLALGATRLVQVTPDIWVANMIGQHGMRTGSNGPPVRYEAIQHMPESDAVAVTSSAA